MLFHDACEKQVECWSSLYALLLIRIYGGRHRLDRDVVSVPCLIVIMILDIDCLLDRTRIQTPTTFLENFELYLLRDISICHMGDECMNSYVGRTVQSEHLDMTLRDDDLVLLLSKPQIAALFATPHDVSALFIV